MRPSPSTDPAGSFLDGLIRFFLHQKLVVLLLVAAIALGGIAVAPFDWEIDWLPRNPVPVDAIPNLGENQQIVFAEWAGRSPQDVEDQITYPLTVSLLGVPGVREVRSQSMFGLATVFVIFEEDVEFYWSRARLIEKLNSLPAGALPDDVQPALGPDATALGQVFWYTLEGRDPEGNPVGGWDLDELRSLQDWHVRYGLLAAEGISEIASIGGFVPEYQIDVDPDAMRMHGVTLQEVLKAVRESNLDTGAGITEINRVEYLIRGRGYVQSLEDLEEAVVRVTDDFVPLRIRDVATVGRGPAPRRGALTVGGAEAVGGVAVVREGYNPLQAIGSLREKIREISPGLPARAVVDWERAGLDAVREFAGAHGLALESAGLNQEQWLQWLRTNPRENWPEWLTTSQVTVVSFYDRSGLIHETLATLNDALLQQVLVTVIVVLLLVLHFRTALVISAMLPLAVFACFIAMSLFGVDANVVALAGIAIAIGTIVDMGVIVVENVLKHLREAPQEEPRIEIVFRATSEVGSAIVTAISTTVVSFLPVFTMSGAEGKMFIPLAFTKTFVLIGSVIVVLTVVPAATHLFIAQRIRHRATREKLLVALAAVSVLLLAIGWRQGWTAVTVAAAALLGFAAIRLVAARVNLGKRLSPEGLAKLERSEKWIRRIGRGAGVAIAVGIVLWLLAVVWEPLGPERGLGRNLLFLLLMIGALLGFFALFGKVYAGLLRFFLERKSVLVVLLLSMVSVGVVVWFGFDRSFGFLPRAAGKLGVAEEAVPESGPWRFAENAFPGLGREFMPTLDEGTFLWMPTTGPHASIGEVLDVLKHQDRAIEAIPEIETVVGKIGRAETALDPAPVSMLETVIHYKSEYITDDSGRRLRFRYDRKNNRFLRDEAGELIPDPNGMPYRQWRDHIRTPDDIWEEIVEAARLPGTTSAPKLQPIETRRVMLQTGMRAPMGVKVRGPDLDTLGELAVALEGALREVPVINAATVNAERVVGAAYLEIDIDRRAIGRYGLTVAEVQQTIAAAIGGETVTQTVQGRERYPVRVRYAREMRDGIDEMLRVIVTGANGAEVPLAELAEIEFVRGPQMIQSENTFLTTYVTFGGAEGVSEVDVVKAAQAFLTEKIAAGELSIPPGTSWRFAGDYENQLHAAATLRVVLPVALAIIFLILYFQFRSVLTSLIVFSGIAVAWAGGFILIWLYGQNWFLDFSVLGVHMRDLFQVRPLNLSVGVWVGFLALFGIAVDNGVVMAAYLKQVFDGRKTATVQQIREATVAAGLRRLRPCLMTTATTVLALLPVLTSSGRGSELMTPMAIPSVGGMFFVLLTLISVPVLYAWRAEQHAKRTEPPLAES